MSKKVVYVANDCSECYFNWKDLRGEICTHDAVNPKGRKYLYDSTESKEGNYPEIPDWCPLEDANKEQ